MSNKRFKCLIHLANKLQQDLEAKTANPFTKNTPQTWGSICFAALVPCCAVLPLHIFCPTLVFVLSPAPRPLVSLSCSRGSPSRGGILTPTLLLCAACSPDAAWSLSPARRRSCTWSSRTVRWESHTWPSPLGCAASAWGCSTALEVEKETTFIYHDS